MDLGPYAPADFAELMTWFATGASLIQRGRVDMVFPLHHAKLAAMQAEDENAGTTAVGFRCSRVRRSSADVGSDRRHTRCPA